MTRLLIAPLLTAAGITLGLISCALINSAHIALPIGVRFVLLSDHLAAYPTLQWVLTVSLFITTVVTLISLIPSFIAARLKPVTAMQHAG